MQWLQELLNESNSIREYFYSSAANLKTVMTLLGSDPSVTIRFKALNIMQVYRKKYYNYVCIVSIPFTKINMHCIA